MRRLFKGNKLLATLAIVFSGVLLLSNFVFAATSNDYLIKVGTGQYAVTVTNDTTIEQISNVLGSPKLTTDSAFGGQAYTFYTDDKYSNYLYIETNADGIIASYGSIDPSFQTPSYSYDSTYNYQDNSIMHGCLFNVSGKIKGGIFYNRNLYWPSTTQFLKNYESTYLGNEVLYSYGISKQSVTMFNAISKAQDYTNSGIIFDDEIFYRNAQLKELGTDLRSMAVTLGKSNEITAIAQVKENIDITSNYYVLNPLIFAMSVSSAKTKDFGEKNLAVFDYNSDSKILYTGTTIKNILQKSYQDIAYTADEKAKLQAGRELYAKAITELNIDDATYIVEPQTTTPSSLVAGELTDSKKQGAVDYLSAIRVAGGLKPLVINEMNMTSAQYKAALLDYRWAQLGLVITHTPTKPSGVTDEFFAATSKQDPMGTFTELVSRASIKATGKSIVQHINNLIQDNGVESLGHRFGSLYQLVYSLGFGISGEIAVEHSNINLNDNSFYVDMEAWPSNGITFMESLPSNKFRWSVIFERNYQVQANTTVSVRCLNTEQSWSWTEKEGSINDNRFFKRDLSGTPSNQLQFTDYTIEPQAGFVYEITVHNLLDDITNKNTDYTYRAVFENADPENSLSGVSSLKINVPEEITKDSSSNYLVGVGQEVKLSLNANSDSKYTNWMMNWTSSNSEVVEVTQNGMIKVKSFTNSPIKIEATNPQSGLKDSITILPVIEGGKLTLDKTSYQLNTLNETVKLTATLNGVNMTGVIWKSSNDSIATVSQNGTVTAKNGGFVTISASLANYGTVTCNIYVAILRPLSDGSKAYPGDLNRDGTINSTDASEVLNWYNKSSLTDDEIAVADVDGDGRVTSTDASYIMDMYRQGSLFMPGQYKPINNVNISSNNLSLDPKQIVYLTARYLPSDTTDSPTFAWKSSNQNVATVDNNGRVIAVAGGTATITATADNGRGKSAKCTITVSGDLLEIEISSITLNNAPAEITVGDTTNLSVSILPENTTQDKTITWSSSNDSIISVDANGKITANTVGTATITATTKNGKTAQCTIAARESSNQEPILQFGVSYQANVQDRGWLDTVSDGKTAGTAGLALRMEGLKVKLINQNLDGDIEYRSQLQQTGWEQDWKKNGELTGTDGKGLRLEALQVRLTGSVAKEYDVYYRVQTQRFGWLGWAKNGEPAGTAGFGYRVEAIEIKLVKKGETVPWSSAKKFVSIDDTKLTYQANVQNKGWLDVVKSGETAGTAGLALRMEGLKIHLSNQVVDGNIEYRSQLQQTGWESTWRKNGELTGTDGKRLRLEALQVRLTGTLNEIYDVYYRVQTQHFGWLGWAKNGEPAGTAGLAYRVEAIEIILVKKGQPAPDSTENKFRNKI